MSQGTPGRVLAGLGLLAVALATLTPTPMGLSAAMETPIWCLVCGSLGSVDIVLNVLLFVPLGLGLRLAGLGWGALMAAVVATTFSVETLQFALIIGRDPSLSDLLTNSLGGALGAVLGDRWRWLVFPSPSAGRILAWSMIVAWLGTAVVTAWALVPAPPRTPTYWGQWAPAFPNHERFRGEVGAVRLQGIPIPNDSVPSTTSLRRTMTVGPIVLRADVTAGPPTDDLAPIVSVGDGQGNDAVLLQQRGRELLFSVRSRAARLRLRGLGVQLKNALPETPGETLVLAAGYRNHHLWLLASTPESIRAREIALSPQLGWSLLVPFAYGYGSATSVTTALWIAGFMALISYWAAFGYPLLSRVVAGAGGLAVLGVGLYGLPAVAHYPATAWSEWVAGAAGLVAGFVLGHRSRRNSVRKTAPTYAAPSALSAASP